MNNNDRITLNYLIKIEDSFNLFGPTLDPGSLCLLNQVHITKGVKHQLISLT